MNTNHVKRCLNFLAVGLVTVVGGCASPSNDESQSYCENGSDNLASSTQSIKVMSLNLAHARRQAFNQMFVADDDRDQTLTDIASLMQNFTADVVALQEADAASRWSGKFNHVAHLRDSAGYQCSLQGHHSDNWLFTYGSALLSRIRTYGEQSVRFEPTPPTTTKGFVKAVVDWNFEGTIVPVTVVSVHLDFASGKARTAQITQMVDNLQNIEPPLIVMGDLNSHWNQRNSHVKMLTSLLDLKAFDADDESLGTFRSPRGKRLDWILISQDLKFLDYRALDEAVSDHLSVYAEIAYQDPPMLSNL